MLKVVVFDSGYGGEFFADVLEAELPVLDIIRVIDWHHAETYLTDPKQSRKLVEAALRPYIGKVDLIVLANHLISATSLKYFKRKYPEQQFVGFKLKTPDTFIKYDTLILTTRALTKTMEFHGYIFRLKRKVGTITVDAWPAMIDDGELTHDEIARTIESFIKKKHIQPKEVVLANSNLEDIKPALRSILGCNVRIYSSFEEAIRELTKILRLRGGSKKK